MLLVCLLQGAVQTRKLLRSFRAGNSSCHPRYCLCDRVHSQQVNCAPWHQTRECSS